MPGKITVVPIDGSTLRVSCGDASVDIDLTAYVKGGTTDTKAKGGTPAFDPFDPANTGVLPYAMVNRTRSVTFARVKSLKELPLATKKVGEHVRIAAPGRGKRLIFARMADRDLDLHAIKAAMKDTPADTHLVITMRGRK